MTILPTNNQDWGFWGSMSRIDMDAQAAWATAMNQISEQTRCSQEATREFLDSAQGRHFADEVANELASGEALDAAIAAGVRRWMSWKISARFHRETGIPRGLPYLTGLVAHFEILGEAE